MSNVYLLKFLFELESNFLFVHADLANEHDSAVPLQVSASLQTADISVFSNHVHTAHVCKGQG